MDCSVASFAPHTIEDLVDDAWNRKYPRSLGVYPPGVSRMDKYFSPVGRVDNVYGDRNLVCTCPSTEDYREQAARVEWAELQAADHLFVSETAS